MLTASLFAGKAWYYVEGGKIVYSNVIPYSKNKDKVIKFGHYCKGEKFDGNYYRIKTIIWQEHPCLLIEKGSSEIRKIDNHTVEMTLPEGTKYFTIGDEWEIDPKIKNSKVILGNKNCEDKFSGKEIWTTYYLKNGKWKFGCKSTFIFK